MPDGFPAGPFAVIGLGLLASVGWGLSDFGGGLTSRRAPFLGVLGGSQLASLVAIVPILALVTEPAVRPVDVALAVGVGVIGGLGLAVLYRGLSIGRMGVVAPVAAVLTAALPVGYGFLTEGIPSNEAVLGIAFAAGAVVLVSRSPAAPDGRPSGLRYGLAAGVAFGTFTVAVAQLPEGLVIAPLVLFRVGSLAVIGLWIGVRRMAWRVPLRLWPALLLVGMLDLGATAAYLGSVQIGPLAIAAILASLYPVVTAVLAAVVLRERVTLTHAAGILAAGVGVALIAGASAG